MKIRKIRTYRFYAKKKSVLLSIFYEKTKTMDMTEYFLTNEMLLFSGRIYADLNFSDLEGYALKDVHPAKLKKFHKINKQIRDENIISTN